MIRAPRTLRFAVGTALLASAPAGALVGCEKKGTDHPHTNVGPEAEPEHTNVGPAGEPAEKTNVGPEEETTNVGPKGEELPKTNVAPTKDAGVASGG